MSQLIPKEILEHAKYLTSDDAYMGIFPNDEERLKTVRNQALEAINRYKELKLMVKERNTIKSRISEWLKSVTE